MPVMKFRHFSPEEKEIMKAFMEAHPALFNYRFDVRVGGKKAELADIKEEWVKLMWKSLLAKRIDAVAEDRSYLYIIEVKQWMLLSGVGQLLGYKELYKQTYPVIKPIKLVYAVRYPDPDVIDVCKAYGINWWSEKPITYLK